jgi:hypothetical protein
VSTQLWNGQRLALGNFRAHPRDSCSSAWHRRCCRSPALVSARGGKPELTVCTHCSAVAVTAVLEIRRTVGALCLGCGSLSQPLRREHLGQHTGGQTFRCSTVHRHPAMTRQCLEAALRQTLEHCRVLHNWVYGFQTAGDVPRLGSPTAIRVRIPGRELHVAAIVSLTDKILGCSASKRHESGTSGDLPLPIVPLSRV